MSTNAPPPEGSYPAEWEADVVLSDGGTVHVRPVRPTDADRLVAFHGRLSHQSVYYRFFSPRPRLSPDDVKRFTTVDYDNRMALVALLGDDLIGIASYDRWPGRRDAEVAFTVDDEHQGRGVATVLLEHLAVVARSHGITRFTAEVLPENRKMLSVFKRAGFEAHSAFADGVVAVEMGILETDAALEAMHEREHVAEARSIARLLAPRTIAVIGAGEHRGTVGHEVLRNLIAHGFNGAVYPVHPTAHSIASVRAWPTVLEVPDDVDLAVISVPAAEVLKVVEQCARKRVRGLVVLAAGFGDVDVAGETAERDLVSIAHRHGMRLLGPASMGVITTVPSVSMHATFAPVNPIPGRVAFSSQSGPLGVALLEQARRAGVGISHFVALGNKADVSTNDFLQFWEGDDATAVIALHIASFGNPRKFTRIARRVSRTKPIVAVKTGGGDADRTVDALFRQTGVIPVGELAELFDVARVLESQPLPNGDRVAVLSNAHGALSLAQAALAQSGLRLAEIGADARAHLSAALPTGAVVSNPIALTFGAEPSDYDVALRTVLAEDTVDAALVIFASPLPSRVEDIADVIVAGHAANPHKPVLASVLGLGDRGLEDAGGRTVPAFAFPETAVATLARVTEHALWKHRPEGVVPDLEALGIDLGRAAVLVQHALDVRPSGTLLPWSVAADLLDSFGIAVARGVAVASVDAAVDAADALGYPVALKAMGIVRRGRSEAAGVALDLHDPAAVRAAYGRMQQSLGAGMAEALVQVMTEPGLETAVGIHHDATFGPVVTFGLGGAFARAIADMAKRVTPLTDRDAHDLVRSARAWSVLSEGSYAIDAVEGLLVRIGQLADWVPEIADLSMNPVLVSGSAAIAVDLSVRVAPAPAGPDNEARRMLRAASAV